MKEKILLFDFDGTLTRRDTLLEFIRYARGTDGLLIGLLLSLPSLVLMKLHLADNGQTKERLFARCFKDMDISYFNLLCQRFAYDKRKRLLRTDGMGALKKGLDEGARVMVVSASVDNWVAPFFKGERQPEIVGTQIEVKDGRLTGRFLTPNCYGAEKVRRIKALLTMPRTHYYIKAYGDSRGDKEMLEYADEGLYKQFSD